MDNRSKGIWLIARAKQRIGIAALVSALILLSTEVLLKDAHFIELEEVEPIVEQTVEVEEYIPIAFDPADIKDGMHIPTGMIADTGCAEVVQNCGACHSLDLVKQNKATRDGWKEIIVWMQETQKLWDLGSKENVILDYLAKNYGPENTGRRKNLENIEWYDL